MPSRVALAHLSTWWLLLIIGPIDSVIQASVESFVTSSSDAISLSAADDDTDAWILRLTAASAHAHEALQRHQDDKITIYSDSFLTSEPIASVTKSLEASIDFSQQIQQWTLQRDALVQEANTMQLVEWANELHLRFEAAITALDQPSSTHNQSSPGPTNTTLDFSGSLNATEILNTSETAMKQWISQMIQAEVEQEFLTLDSHLLQSIDTITEANDASDASPTVTTTSTPCVSALQAATEVHAALIRYSSSGADSESLVDYASAIVQSHTSPTYIPVVTTNEWAWHRYCPQDWQDGWSAVVPREWSDTGGALVASLYQMIVQPQLEYLWHSLAQTAPLALPTRSAPPQAILQASNFPGHCWPVAMREQPHSSRRFSTHRGGESDVPQVTIRLQQPLTRITTIIIDHVDRIFLTDPDLQLQSAPKRLKVYGYAPCDGNQTRDCAGLGFDPTTSRVLTEIQYDIHSDTNIQAFTVSSSPSPVGASLKQTNDVVFDDEDHSDSDGTSCSAVQATSEPSCGGGSPDRPVTAITVQILENWGNEDYTCLYGIRVHGER